MVTMAWFNCKPWWPCSHSWSRRMSMESVARWFSPGPLGTCLGCTTVSLLSTCGQSLLYDLSHWHYSSTPHVVLLESTEVHFEVHQYPPLWITTYSSLCPSHANNAHKSTYWHSQFYEDNTQSCQITHTTYMQSLYTSVFPHMWYLYCKLSWEI